MIITYGVLSVLLLEDGTRKENSPTSTIWLPWGIVHNRKAGEILNYFSLFASFPY